MDRRCGRTVLVDSWPSISLINIGIHLHIQFFIQIFLHMAIVVSFKGGPYSFIACLPYLAVVPMLAYSIHLTVFKGLTGMFVFIDKQTNLYIKTTKMNIRHKAFLIYLIICYYDRKLLAILQIHILYITWWKHWLLVHIHLI